MLPDLAPSFGTNPELPGGNFSDFFLFDRRSWSFWSKRLRKFRAHPLQPGILGLIVVGLMWGPIVCYRMKRRNRWRGNKKHVWPLKELDLLESPLKFSWINTRALTREIQWRLLSNLWLVFYVRWCSELPWKVQWPWACLELHPNPWLEQMRCFETFRFVWWFFKPWMPSWCFN